eukprot:6191084-Pleurochrysis_carterae.AAC.1
MGGCLWAVYTGARGAALTGVVLMGVLDAAVKFAPSKIAWSCAHTARRCRKRLRGSQSSTSRGGKHVFWRGSSLTDSTKKHCACRRSPPVDPSQRGAQMSLHRERAQ